MICLGQGGLRFPSDSSSLDIYIYIHILYGMPLSVVIYM